VSLLSVENLSVEYPALGGADKAVSDVSFHVDKGEVVGIVGESGSGKSSATLAVLGLTRGTGQITQGSVKLDDRELLGLSDAQWREVRGARIGLVTQNPRGALSPISRVGDQISAVYRAHRGGTEEQARARAIHLLRTVGINDAERRMEAYPHELSGGMAQRIVIAMGLSCEPELLLADEPTSGLDVTVQAQVLDDLRRAVSDTGSSLLIVSQDLGIVANYCDRVYMMHAGEVLEQAPVARFFAEPASPATVALLAAQRKLDIAEIKLHGFPASGRNLPAGCWLHPRCPFALAEAGCMTVHPELQPVTAGHEVRCHRKDDVRTAAAAHLDNYAGELVELA
jgi:oligopeptide/dipeptide ABC transporter ATP-binding protein